MNFSTSHRGLTLLEVLIATAILALLAAACAPMIARAMVLLRPERSVATVEIIDLSEVADAFMAKPDDFGVKDTPLHAIDQLQLRWPAETEAMSQVGTISIEVIYRAPDNSHVWLQFTCGETRVHRWVAVPDEGREP